MAQSQLAPQQLRSQDESTRLTPRKCLLKGCNRYFTPNHPLDRYCAGDCKDAARRWRLARANLKYRRSEIGKRNRQAQAIRYRARLKERNAAEILQQTDGQESHFADLTPPREGYHKSDSQEKSCCDRPGCYERFTPSPRSPLQTFCSSSCRKALRCVRLREQRWIWKLAIGRYHARDGPLTNAQ